VRDLRKDNQIDSIVIDMDENDFSIHLANGNVRKMTEEQFEDLLQIFSAAVNQKGYTRTEKMLKSAFVVSA